MKKYEFKSECQVLFEQLKPYNIKFKEEYSKLLYIVANIVFYYNKFQGQKTMANYTYIHGLIRMANDIIGIITTKVRPETDHIQTLVQDFCRELHPIFKNIKHNMMNQLHM